MSQWNSSCCSPVIPASSQCCPPQVDLCAVVQNIAGQVSNIASLINGTNQAFCSNTPFYVREVVTRVAGSANRVDADDTVGAQLSANAYRTLRVVNPTANSNDATISIGGNTVTLSPGEDPFEVAYPDHVNTPSVTVLAGAGETVEVTYSNYPVS